MTECSACGAELVPHKTRCPVCGKPTAYYHRQRRCLHCGTPAAEKAKACLVCGQPVDSLPLNTSIFSGSWLGIGLGALIIIGIVIWVGGYQIWPNGAAQASQSTPTAIRPTPTITRTPTATGTPLPTATVTPTPTPTPLTHMVESGQALVNIAKLYGVSVDDIVNLNGIEDAQVLTVGQELLIPFVPASSAGRSSQLPHQIVYVIEEGDTLLGLALRYGTTVEAILAVNPDTNPDLLFPGQDLVVPLATPTPTATPTATLTPTSTPGPLYGAPNLLIPADKQTVTGSTLLFNWTATGFLADDEFYVLQLSWSDGSYVEHWTKSTAWRVGHRQRLADGPIFWTVIIMRRTGTKPDGSPVGVSLTRPVEQRTVQWLE
jgi:LysM repeat protein